MANKIYLDQTVVRVDSTTGERESQFFNPSTSRYYKSGSQYILHDFIKPEKLNVGTYINIQNQRGDGFISDEALQTYLNSFINFKQGGASSISGDHLFESESARDTYFTTDTNYTQIRINLEILINPPSEDPYLQRWLSSTIPTSASEYLDNTSSWILISNPTIDPTQLTLLTSLQNRENGQYVIKDSDNTYGDAAFQETDDSITSSKLIETPSVGILVGPSTYLSASVDALSVKSTITNASAVIIKQKYTDSGFLKSKLFSIAESPEIKVLNTGTDFQDNTAFTISSDKDELITKFDLEIDTVSTNYALQLTIQEGNNLGPVIYQFNNESLTSDENGIISVILKNSLLISQGTDLYIDITGEGLKGSVITTDFVPNLTFYRIPAVQLDSASEQWVTDNEKYVTDITSNGKNIVAERANATDLTVTNPIYDDIGLITGFAKDGVIQITKNSSSPYNQVTVNLLENPCIIYIKGQRIELTENIDFLFPDVEGTHFLFIKPDKTIGSITTLDWEVLRRDNVMLTELYWDADNEKILYLSNSAYKATYNYVQNKFLHAQFGTYHVGGLLFDDFSVDGNGSQNIHCQFSVTSGKIENEDKTFSIDARNLPANIPILYLLGTDNVRLKEGNNFPFIGKTDITSGDRPKYNLDTAGNYTLAEIPAGNYWIMDYFAENGYYNDIVGILATEIYSDETAARNAAKSEAIIPTWIPFESWVHLGRVIFQTDAYTNDENARIISVEPGINYVDTRGTNVAKGEGVSPTNHNNLTHRSDAASHPATAIEYDNSTSELTATNVNTAIDEVDNTVDSHISNNTAHTAENLTYDATQSNLTETKVQGALNEVQGNIESHESSTTAHDAENLDFDNSSNGFTANKVQTAIEEVNTSIDDHENSTSAHDAGNIDFDNSSNDFTANKVQSAIEENDTNIDNHISSSTAHAASDLTYDNTTSGLSASNVKAALDEIDGDVDTHINSNSAHNILTNPLNHTYFVDKSGVDISNNEGFIKSPFLTISKALTFTTSPNDNIIKVGDGNFTEDLTITDNSTVLEGIYVGETVTPTTLEGKITINAGISFFNLVNVVINNFSTEPSLSDTNGSDGFHNYTNSWFSSGNLNNVIEIEDLNAGDINFINCSINGRVNINGTISGDRNIIFKNQTNGTFNVVNNTSANVFIIDSLGARLENTGSGNIYIIGNTRTSNNSALIEVGSNITHIENPYTINYASSNFIDFTSNQSVSGNKTFDGSTVLDATTINGLLNVTDVLNATTSSDIRLGSSDRLRINSNGVVLSSSIYLNESGTMPSISGKIGLGSGANYLFTVRGDGDVTYLDNWRYITVTSASVTLEAYDRVIADTTSNNVELLLPSAANNLQPVEIIAKKGDNTLTIDGNGNNIRVFGSDGTLLDTDTSVTTSLNRVWIFRYITDAWDLHI